MSELTERIEALEKENEHLKSLDSVRLQKVNGLREIIKVLKEEFPRCNVEQILPQVVRIEL